MHPAHWGLIQPMKLFPPPLHLCLSIILKCQSAFPLALWLPFLSSLSHTHTHAHSGLHRKSTVCSLHRFHISTHTKDTHTHTYVMDTHMYTNRPRVRERKRDPKHQNSINPLKRSLKGFLKADFHHTEAFQVSTVCGGNGAEAFKLYALTFPPCYFLFLPLAHTVFLPLSLLLFSAFVSASFLRLRPH